MNAQQLMNQDDKRAEAINQLSELASQLELSYVVDDGEMRIHLPKPDDVELPIVAKIEVPLEEKNND